MKSIIAKILGATYFIKLLLGLYGFVLCLGVLIDELGFLGGLIGFLIAPVTFFFVPWYEALWNENWFLVKWVYGGGILVFVLHWICIGLLAFLENSK